MAAIPYPPRVHLARAGTPLEPLTRTGAALGVELWIKRDDLTGAELTGNKVRKLEFLFAEARARGATHVITCGGEQSNHCRATALAAARLGFGCRLILRTDDPTTPPAATANILLDRLAGATIRWISRPDWARREALLAEEADRVRADGGVPYVIPEGGSSATGAWGYVACAEELAADLAALPPRPTTILYACGSGGTGAGLEIGARLCGLDARIAGINVCDDGPYFQRAISRIASELIAAAGLDLTIGPDDVALVDGHVGAGYARSRPEELTTIAEVCRADGVVLDPVYSGKAFHGLVTELRRDRTRFGERVVFIHTGGVFGLFPAAPLFAPLLSAG